MQFKRVNKLQRPQCHTHSQRYFGMHMPSSSLHRSCHEVSFICFLPLPPLPIVLSPLILGSSRYNDGEGHENVV